MITAWLGHPGSGILSLHNSIGIVSIFEKENCGFQSF
jgi:hypothetical protein